MAEKYISLDDVMTIIARKHLFKDKTDFDKCVHAIAEQIKALDTIDVKPQGDLISREAVLELTKIISEDYSRERASFQYFVEKLPSVEPQEKIGHWIINTDLGYFVSICSCCDWRGHGDTKLIYKPNYCPNCGAKMDKGE